MQGQAGVFYRYAPEKIPFAIERYQKETRRLYEVLDKQLQGREFVCGDISIAGKTSLPCLLIFLEDFALFPWVNAHEWVGVSVDGLDNLKRWLQTMKDRPAVKRGLDVPSKHETQLTEKATEERITTARSLLIK